MSIGGGRTKAHDELSAKALSWVKGRLTRRGGRGGFEFPAPGVGGYIADAACIGSFQWRHFKRYVFGWGMAATSWEAKRAGRVEAPNYFCMVFEAKASRSDFQATFGGRNPAHVNRLSAVGHLHWVVADKGVCEAVEVPEPWGLLVRSGGGLTEVKPPTYCGMGEDEVDRFAHRLLWLKPRGTWSHHETVDEEMRLPGL